MYEIALSVVACLRTQTRADVAWQLSTDIPKFVGTPGGVMMTPGGGRIGNLLDGVFEGQLADVTARQLPFATIQRLVVGPAEALSSGLDMGASAEVMVSPAELVPLNAWEAFLEKTPVVLHGTIVDGVIREFSAWAGSGIAEAPQQVLDAYARGDNTVVVTKDEVVCVFSPRTRLVIAGGGPIAAALSDVAKQLGWDAVIEAGPTNVAGLTANLSPMDAVVVLGHDVEASSRCLEAALQSQAGYIGALGSLKMQQQRADWLSFRDVTDLSRVHGPAGFDIGAETPHEIAVSILAEAIAVKQGRA